MLKGICLYELRIVQILQPIRSGNSAKIKAGTRRLASIGTYGFFVFVDNTIDQDCLNQYTKTNLEHIAAGEPTTAFGKGSPSQDTRMKIRRRCDVCDR